MLVLDAFRCHKTDGTKELLRQHNTDLVVIPGGMTSLLQPLDVCINLEVNLVPNRVNILEQLIESNKCDKFFLTGDEMFLIKILDGSKE